MQQQGKFISDQLYIELLSYSDMQDRHLDWETRDQYLELLNEFMEEKIDIPDFCIAFCRRSELNGEVADMLKSNLVLLSPHKKSIEFSVFIQEILSCCEVYSGDPGSLRES